MTPRRTPIVVVLLAALLVGGLADRLGRHRDRTSVSAGPAMPAPGPPNALSSTWYCAAGSTEAGSPMAGAVVVANPGRRALTATVTAMPSDPAKEPVVKVIDLPSLSSKSIDLRTDASGLGDVGVLVEIDGGEAVVEHSIGGKSTKNVDACSTTSSDHWYFADGSTAKDATLTLALFNPFPEDAIADLNFATDQGRATPADFQGLVVQGRSVRMVDIGEHVRRRESVATTVTVRSGRLVADQVQVRGAVSAGTSLARGAPDLGSTWFFPNGLVSANTGDALTVYNPSGKEAEVEVDVDLDRGSAEPFELTVPPAGTAQLVLAQEARIPKDTSFSLTVRSGNGVPVAVQRTLVTAPPDRSGRSDSVGASRAARRWATAAGTATEDVDEWITVQNVTSHAATVSIRALADGQFINIDGLQNVSIPAHRHQSFRLGDHIKRDELPLVIDATQLVVVERSIYAVKGEGLMGTIAIPTT